MAEESDSNPPQKPKLRGSLNTVPPQDDSDDEQPLTAPIVRYCNAIISTAIDQRATEFRVEPSLRNVRVRVCVDGLWQQLLTMPKHVQYAILNRYKVMADIPFWQKGVLYGHIPIKHGDQYYDLQVSGVPGLYGDTLSFRIVPLVTRVHFDRSDENLYEPASRVFDVLAPGKIVLIVGLPRSGKTGTAFALLQHLNKEESSLATIEQQQGYRLKGGLQTYRNPARAVTASALVTAHQRGGVDTLLVDPINDADSADAAFTAAESGMKVLATLTVSRIDGVSPLLQKWGISPARVGNALGGTLHQRLVRRLCDACRTPFHPTPEHRRTYARHGLNDTTYLATAKGCEACVRGFKGQTAIYSFVRPENDATVAAQLNATAIGLVRDGITTFDEVASILSPERQI